LLVLVMEVVLLLLQLLLLLPILLLLCYTSQLHDTVGASCSYVLLPVACNLLAEPSDVGRSS
jgi:hypothetical protein